MTERQILSDAIGIGRISNGGLAKAATALGVFGLGQMPATRGKADDLAGGGDFEPFGHGFPSFDAFGTTHKLFQFSFKRARNLRDFATQGKREFS
jgi:hypothetical protein